MDHKKEVHKRINFILSLLLIFVCYLFLKVHLCKYFNPVKINDILDSLLLYGISLAALIFVNSNRSYLRKGFFLISFITILALTLYASINLIGIYYSYLSEIVNKIYYLVNYYQLIILNIINTCQFVFMRDIINLLYFKLNVLTLFIVALILYDTIKNIAKKYLYKLRIKLCLDKIEYPERIFEKAENISLGYMYNAIP